MKASRPFRALTPFLLLTTAVSLEGCTAAKPDAHVCDVAEVISLQDVPRFVGTWVQDRERPDEGYQFTISPEGDFLHPALGCKANKYPLVFEDYNNMPGTDGPGTGYRRLEYVQITPSELKFFWKVNENAKFRSKEREELMVLKLRKDGTMRFEFTDSGGRIDLYRVDS